MGEQVSDVVGAKNKLADLRHGISPRMSKLRQRVEMLPASQTRHDGPYTWATWTSGGNTMIVRHSALGDTFTLIGAPQPTEAEQQQGTQPSAGYTEDSISSTPGTQIIKRRQMRPAEEGPVVADEVVVSFGPQTEGAHHQSETLSPREYLPIADDIIAEFEAVIGQVPPDDPHVQQPSVEE